MSFNDTETIDHLLIWLNRERIELNQEKPIELMSDLCHSKLLRSILIKIEPTFFGDLSEVFSFDTYFQHMEKYLNENQGKRLKRTVRQPLSQILGVQVHPTRQLQHIQVHKLTQIVIFLLYLIVQSNLKNQFVSRIFQLSNETQSCLMVKLQQIQSNMQNIMQVKQILEKVEDLQDENDALMQQTKQFSMRNNNLRRMIELVQEQQNKLAEQTRKNRQQRNKIMQQIMVCDFRDYLTIYRDLQLENKMLFRACQFKEKNNLEIVKCNEEMKDKIVEDRLTIAHLNHQIANYRSMEKQLREQMNASSSRLNKENEYVRSSWTMRYDINEDSDFHGVNSSIIEQEDGENEKIRKRSSELVSRLQEMNTRIQHLTEEANALKESNKLFKKHNQRHESILQKARAGLKSFIEGYAPTVMRF